MNTQMLNPLSLLDAVYEYVKNKSNLEENCIFQGGNNFSHLPKEHNNFAILTLLSLQQIGTNQETYHNDTIIIESLIKIGVQVDIYGNTLLEAWQNMLSTHSLFHDHVACNFFIPLGYTPLYADEIKVINTVDSSNQYVPRLTTTFYFSYKNINVIPFDFFDSVKVNVVNVDVKFPPIGDTHGKSKKNK